MCHHQTWIQKYVITWGYQMMGDMSLKGSISLLELTHTDLFRILNILENCPNKNFNQTLHGKIIASVELYCHIVLIGVPVITHPCYGYTSCVEDGWGWCTVEPIHSQGSFCVCTQPMRDDCRLSLAERMHRMLPEFPRPQLVVHAVYH